MIFALRAASATARVFVKSPAFFKSMGRCHTLHSILGKITGKDLIFLAFLVSSPTITLFADFSPSLATG